MSARCTMVRWQLPSSSDGSLRGPGRAHAETCLRCQAELAKYRSLHRRLAGLASVTYEAPPGLATGVLTDIDAPVIDEAVPDSSVAIRASVAVAAAGAAAVAAAVAVGVRRYLTA